MGQHHGLLSQVVLDLHGDGDAVLLFEIVEGAVLLVTVPNANDVVEANIVVTTGVGREFVYTARTAGGADRVARLRLPYSNESPAVSNADGGSKYRTRTGPAWTIAIGGVPDGEIVVPEAAVLQGHTLRYSKR